MSDPLSLIAFMLGSLEQDAFHVAEWDTSEALWIETADVGRLRWLMRSSLAERHDLSLSACPYLDKGSYRLHGVASCLWVRTETGESAKRLAKFKPVPTIVLRDGKTNRMTAFWALKASLPPDEAERANRRLSYALHTPAKHCEPGFRFHPPGVVLRAGRTRPLVIVVAEQSDELYPVGMTKRLKDRPKADAAKWSRAA